MLNTPSMEINSHLANRLLLVFIIFSTPALISSLLRISNIGFQPIMGIQISLYFISAAIFFFRNQVFFKLKAYFITSCFLLLAIGGMIQFGLFGAGILLMIMYTALCSLLFNRISALISIAVGFIIITSIGIAYITGHLTYIVNAEEYHTSANAWFLMLGTTIFVATNLYIVLTFMSSQYQQSLTELDKQVKLRTKAYEAEKMKAEKASEIKSQFLANMSHEIRTPMNGVLGVMQLLRLEHPNEKQNALIDTAIFSAENLLRILNDILDFSKIEANKLDIENIEFELQPILDSIYSNVELDIDMKGISLNFINKTNENALWTGDPTRFYQVLLNLVTNAAKFTDTGAINVYITQKSINGVSYLTSEVVDTGIGMSTEEINNLFQNFSQADASITRKFGGTGLGLSIAKRLATLMGGNLTVTSKRGEGSTFIFTIKSKFIISPLVSAKNPKITGNDLAPDWSNKRILIAEDNRINQKIICAMLKPTHALLHCVNNGREAVDLAFDFTPDIVLMDIQMPEMDGVTASIELRDRQFNKPIIAFTANVMKGDVEHYLANGMNDFIPKPVDMNLLYRTLSKFLQSDQRS
ncbi:ATP-binding protein [Colwellia sp. Bg11-12]|uniref:ATP-binding protein n=1 Tax=Colwellia sp. Bg11-12 TaxID=2759817 RepID=UPI0015F3E5DD|nr:ATP-binding protein [Colwellia sp. Bg11-12]MBA6264840.1 response regulator [Colwellia sp. Bg11-12]